MIRRIFAAITVAALCICLCSCGYNPEKVGYVVADDGTKYDITCGRYLAAQFTSADAAMYTVDPIGMTPLGVVLEGMVETKRGRQWVTDKTEETLIRAAAIERIWDEYGLEFTPDELYIYEYYIGYGWSNYYSVYMANGIGYNSYYDYQINAAKDSLTYAYLYGEGGKLQIEDSIVQEYLDNATARITHIATPYQVTDSEIQLTDDDYETLDRLAAELYADVVEMGFEAALEKYTPIYEDILGEGCMEGAYIGSTLIVAGDNSFVEPMEQTLLNTDIGSYGIYDAGAHVYCIFSRDALTEEDTFSAVRSKVVDILGPEMFEKMIAEYIEGWSLELDQKAVKYYSVDKVKV